MKSFREYVENRDLHEFGNISSGDAPKFANYLVNTLSDKITNRAAQQRAGDAFKAAGAALKQDKDIVNAPTAMTGQLNNPAKVFRRSLGMPKPQMPITQKQVGTKPIAVKP